MYDNQFLSRIREHSLETELDDLQREWNLYTFRYDDARCVTCRMETQKIVIFNHDQLATELILCPQCARKFKQVNLTHVFMNILRIKHDSTKYAVIGLLENALSAEVITRDNYSTYKNYRSKKNIALEVEEFMEGINQILVKNYYRIEYYSMGNRFFQTRSKNINGIVAK